MWGNSARLTNRYLNLPKSVTEGEPKNLKKSHKESYGLNFSDQVLLRCLLRKLGGHGSQTVFEKFAIE